MALLIGMDEAGLGPNLGPFVVAVTVWEIPGSPDSFDFWSAFDTVLTNAPAPNDPRLHVADSKQVFQPNRGLSALERGVWSALQLLGSQASTYGGLLRNLASTEPVRPSTPPAAATTTDRVRRASRPSLFNQEELSAAQSPAETDCIGEDSDPLPWYDGDGVALPLGSTCLDLVEPWQRICDRIGVRLLAIRADVVEPLRFNRLVRQYDNKSQATSRLAMNLLKRVWQPDGHPALIVADKHGGRNRYDTLLSATFQCPVESLDEGAELSRYRLGDGEVRFQPRAESFGPVAMASMMAKYLREVAMHQFNGFWQTHLPDLKPTQGYPLDARRFYDSISAEQIRLKIPDKVLWRDR